MSSAEATVTNPICVALDTPDPDEARELARSLSGEIGGVKVGLTSFAIGGAGLVRDLAEDNEVFLDLKLHDISSQVEGAVRAIAQLGASITTVHAAGGRAMIRAAVAGATGSDLKVVAVTVLTSLDDSELADLGMKGGATDSVLRLAELALSSGVHGLVCSPLEVAVLRERFGPHDAGGPYLVVPGIRPDGAAPGDQRRTLTPNEARAAGADLLVVGRPITAASDPVAAAREISSRL